MAFANLFASPPGELDFNDVTPAGHRSDQSYQNTKRPYETPRNTNPKKRKRKNDVKSNEAWRRPNSHKESQDHRVPFKDEQVDVHQKLSPCWRDKETPQNRLWPVSKGHLKDGQRSHKINRTEDYVQNKMHRGNVNEYTNKQQGRETNNGKGSDFDVKNMTKQGHRNAFNQRGKAGSKKGRDNGRKQAWQRPPQEKRKPSMTQEFKEQNSFEVNGRLICKHFHRDRCLKGDQCQFEHSYDLGDFKFNEVCKFYIQGFCLKGERCLFMHTFPCKFFHAGRRCHQGASCKFSHDALTELTKGLLDKLLEEQRAASEPTQCETQEPKAEPAVDFLTNPIKMSFYSTAPAPETQSAGLVLSSEAKDAELTPESLPISTNQTTLSSTAHTQPSATPPAASIAQTSPVKLNLFNSAPPPVCRFSFGANSADFTPHAPISARQARLSPAQRDPHTPPSASPPTQPSASAQPNRPATVSSAPSRAEDTQSVETEGQRSTTPPGATSSVLRTLFTHLSPCRPDDEEEEDEALDAGSSQNVADGADDKGSPTTKLCAKNTAKVKEDSDSNPRVQELEIDLKPEPGEAVLALKAESQFVEETKKEEVEREEPFAIPLNPVPCASTPIANTRRTYQPLAVDLSPLPPLPFKDYHPHTSSPQTFSSKTLNTSANSNSQSAVRRYVPLKPRGGVCQTQAEPQGRHSLPVQTPTWSVPSAGSVRQPAFRNGSLNMKRDPC